MKRKTWFEKYKASEKRRFDKMEKRRLTLKNPVYAITPLEHGNGGWCGATIHGVYELDWILKRNPVKLFHDGFYQPMWGTLIRLNNIPDANNPLYTWEHDEYCWVKQEKLEEIGINRL